MIVGLIMAFLSFFRPDLQSAAPLASMYREIYKEGRSALPRSKRKEIDKIMKELEKQAFSSAKRSGEVGKLFMELDSDYNSTEEEYLAIVDSLELITESVADHFFHTREKMKSALTEEEWDRAFDKADRYIQKTIRKKEKSFK